ncbi:MAG: DUF456 domain-containing protein [bacterium]|nr:DUF456 domain-containing protein [bacterium]
MWTTIAGILVVLGVAGAILPFLPGPPLSLAGLLIYGFATGFEKMSVTVVIVFAALTLLTIILDVFAPAMGAKGHKASHHGVVGSIIGAFAGLFLLGPLGIILGPFIGGFLGEYLKRHDPQKAWHTAVGAFVGFLWGTLARFAVSLAMAIYFFYVLLK